MSLKFYFAVLFFVLPIHFLQASVTREVKIDQSWRVKYNPNVWEYKYLKVFSGITPHFFENKKEGIRLILQTESHVGSEKAKNRLVESECHEANDFYATNKLGLAMLKKINGFDVCYIETKNPSGEIIAQFLHPLIKNEKSYEIHSYSWKKTNENEINVVNNFLKDQIK